MLLFDIPEAISRAISDFAWAKTLFEIRLLSNSRYNGNLPD